MTISLEKTQVGVSNGLCEHLRACEQCVYFCEHEQLTDFPLAGISLLFKMGYIVLRKVIANNLADTSKTE